MYVAECGYYDNGRVATWLPYQPSQDYPALVHDISQEKLLGEQVDKYFAYWYGGPQVILALYPAASLLMFIFHGRPESS